MFASGHTAIFYDYTLRAPVCQSTRARKMQAVTRKTANSLTSGRRRAIIRVQQQAFALFSPAYQSDHDARHGRLFSFLSLSKKQILHKLRARIARLLSEFVQNFGFAHLLLNSKIKKFSHSFICGKGYSPPLRGENSFLSTVCAANQAAFILSKTPPGTAV